MHTWGTRPHARKINRDLFLTSTAFPFVWQCYTLWCKWRAILRIIILVLLLASVFGRAPSMPWMEKYNFNFLERSATHHSLSSFFSRQKIKIKEEVGLKQSANMAEERLIVWQPMQFDCMTLPSRLPWPKPQVHLERCLCLVCLQLWLLPCTHTQPRTFNEICCFNKDSVSGIQVYIFFIYRLFWLVYLYLCRWRNNETL